MKTFKIVLSFIVISILSLHNINNPVYAIPKTPTKEPVKAAVFLNDLSYTYISEAKKALEDVQKENNNKIEFAFFDSKGNQEIENENIDKALINGFDLFVVKPVSGKVNEIEKPLTKIMHANIPLIIYLPRTTESLKNIVSAYGKVIIIDGDVELSGSLEGKILADVWKTNKEAIDKNKDNIMQYVMLKGPSDNVATSIRTKYSIQTLNEAGIKTQALLTTVCNFDKECARTTIESAFLTLNDKIEAVISNNDDMAIGAIEALQKYGFNKGGDSKYIPVVGIDGIPKAKELINQGIMTGTAIADLRAEVNAIYSVGMNLVSENDPLSGTNYKFDETGYTIKTPYYEYVK